MDGSGLHLEQGWRWIPKEDQQDVAREWGQGRYEDNQGSWIRPSLINHRIFFSHSYPRIRCRWSSRRRALPGT